MDQTVVLEETPRETPRGGISERSEGVRAQGGVSQSDRSHYPAPRDLVARNRRGFHVFYFLFRVSPYLLIFFSVGSYGSLPSTGQSRGADPSGVTGVGAPCDSFYYYLLFIIIFLLCILYHSLVISGGDNLEAKLTHSVCTK